MQGTCIDLEAAYKQCPVLPDHDKYSVFALKKPGSEEVQYFLARALPFGAKASVHGFNRASRALNHVLHEFGGVTVGTYFDDFPLVAPKQLCEAMFRRTIRLLTLLGWSSCEPPSHTSQCLGAKLSFTVEPKIIVSNKDGRVKEVKEMFAGCVARKSISGHEVTQVRGRMRYFLAQCYARIGGHAFRVLNKYDSGAGPRWVDPEMKEAIERWVDAVEKTPPRSISFTDSRPPVRIFTDGACEKKGKEVSYGGFLIDSVNDVVEVFGTEMGNRMKELFSEGGEIEQIIGQAELLPMLVSRMLWSGHFKGRDILHHVDNGSAKFACIKGCSPSRASAWIVHAFWDSEIVMESHSWISRVSTHCNIADGPCRN